MAGYGGHSGHNAYSDAYGAHYHPSNLPPMPFSINDQQVQHDPYQYPLSGQGRDQYQYPASGRGHDQYQQPAAGHGQDPHQYPPSGHGHSQPPSQMHSQPPSQMMSPVGYDHPDQSALIGEGEYIGKRKTGGRKALAGKATAGVQCACCCVFILVLLCISIVVGHLFTRRHHDWEQPIGVCPASENFCLWNQGANLVPSNLTRYLAWNGCGDHKGYLDDATINTCGPPCFDAKLVRAMDSFNNQSAWTYVSFLSRAGAAGQQQLTLTAWWLPADPIFAQESVDGIRSQIPVVVIQHTTNANFDSRMVQTYAYLLRSMGFSVFLPNLRDHGSSQKSTHPNRVTWGYDYFLDLMGAWDYVVADPDGILGGPRKPSSVGIAGMSMGAYVAGIAAGLNPEIPGIWLDSGVFDANYGELYDVLHSYGHYVGLGWFVGMLRAPAWLFAGWWAGVDIGYMQPSTALTCAAKPSSGIPMKVALIDNSKDTFVKPDETRKFNTHMGKYPDCYDVIESWEAESDCHGTHCSMVFQFPEVYRRRSCRFWSSVFGRPESACRLDELPVFGPVYPNTTQPAKTGSSASSSVGSSGSLASDSASGGSSGSLGSSSGSFR